MSRSVSEQPELKAFGRVGVGLLLLLSLTVCRAQPHPTQQPQQPQQSRVAGIPAINSEELVSFPSPEIAFIIGPQLRMGTKLNPNPWFDSTQRSKGISHGQDFPKIPPLQLTGTVQVEKGNAIVRGVGTKFLTEVDPSGPAPFFNGRLRVREGNSNTYQQVQVRSVQSDTQLTLTSPYQYSSQPNAQADTEYSDGSNINGDIYMNANYYDLALCLYALYYRTGDPQHLAAARKVADSWWLSSPIRSGTMRNFDNSTYSPRNSSLGGLMLRALDGRPEMWDWLHAYTRYMFDVWVKQRVNDPQLYQGVRDGSFLLLYAAWLAKVLPDSFPTQAGGKATNGASLRAALLADVENAAVNFFIRLQYPDGSWRWDDGYYKDADGGELRGVMQPFMVGLLLQALIEVDRLSTKPQINSSIRSSLAKACEHLFSGGPYLKDQSVSSLPGVKMRTFSYFYHGGTTVNPKKYVRGDYVGYDTSAAWNIKSARQSISTILPAYGYIYAITGDDHFKQMGDELFESAFGDVKDRLHNEADGSAKNYNQNYRMGGRYLAWRVGSQEAPVGAKPVATTVTSAAEAEPLGLSSATDLLARVFATSSNLSSLSGLNADQVSDLVRQIETVREAFASEKARPVYTQAVLDELQAALAHARTALTMLQSESGYGNDAKTRIEWATARLKRATVRLQQR
jgi:hypothetical protein